MDYLYYHANATLPQAVAAALSPKTIEPLTGLLTHLHSTTVHPSLPFTRFAAVHASRVALAWAAMTRGRKGDVGVLQDLVGYLSTAWGGSSLVALLVSQPPPWLVSPQPFILYTSIFTALRLSGLASFVVGVSPTLVALLGSLADAVLRGSTIAALPSLLAVSSVPATWWTTTLLSGVAVAGGGWIVQTLGMHKTSWTLGRPAMLDGGWLATLDLWGGALAGLVYAALTRSHAELAPLSNVLLAGMPGAAMGVDSDTARVAAVGVLAVLLFGRAVLLAIPKSSTTGVTKAEAAFKIEEDTEVLKTPVNKGASQVKSRRSTPRRSKTPA